MTIQIRRTVGLLALALIAVALMLRPIPAHAAAPTLGYPVYRTSSSPAEAPDQIVRMEISPGTWSIWKTAKQWDAEIDGLTISRGSCATLPTALCVKVPTARVYTNEEQVALALGSANRWQGLAILTGDNERTLLLNMGTTFKENRKPTAAHELGHALGLAHHTEAGLMSTNLKQTDTLSVTELNLLRNWFSIARYDA